MRVEFDAISAWHCANVGNVRQTVGFARKRIIRSRVRSVRNYVRLEDDASRFAPMLCAELCQGERLTGSLIQPVEYVRRIDATSFATSCYVDLRNERVAAQTGVLPLT